MTQLPAAQPIRKPRAACTPAIRSGDRTRSHSNVVMIRERASKRRAVMSPCPAGLAGWRNRRHRPAGESGRARGRPPARRAGQRVRRTDAGPGRAIRAGFPRRGPRTFWPRRQTTLSQRACTEGIGAKKQGFAVKDVLLDRQTGEGRFAALSGRIEPDEPVGDSPGQAFAARLIDDLAGWQLLGNTGHEQNVISQGDLLCGAVGCRRKVHFDSVVGKYNKPRTRSGLAGAVAAVLGQNLKLTPA